MSVPSSSDLGDYVGLAISANTSRVYAWRADGTFSVGSSQNLEAHESPADYDLPDGYNPWDIAAIAIAPNRRVYTFWRDQTVSVGWSQDLAFYEDPTPFELPAGKTVDDIAGIACSKTSGHFYTFYFDGTGSEGWSEDLGHYRASFTYSIPTSKKYGHLFGVALNPSDLFYAWYRDVESGSAHSSIADAIDGRAMDFLRRYRLPGLGVSVSKNGRVVAEKGYGYRNLTDGDRMNSSSRCRIGSVSKVFTALSAMHLHQESSNFSVSDPVYGFGGALTSTLYGVAQGNGARRHQPVVASAMGTNGRVYTWGHNQQFVSGTSLDLDRYSGPAPFTMPANTRPEDIRAIAINTSSGSDQVWTFYDDRTYSIGTPDDLEALWPRAEGLTVRLPPGLSMQNVIGADFAINGNLYVWYDSGERSVGSGVDFDAFGAPIDFSAETFHSRYDIRSMAISKSSGRVVTFFSDDTRSVGWSRDLDKYRAATYHGTPEGLYDSGKDWRDWYDGMQVDHLLSHSSGLPRSGDVESSTWMFNTDESQLSYAQLHRYMLSTRKLRNKPGYEENYSNHGLGLVGHIVSTRSGMSYRDYVETHIFDPIGVNIIPSSIGQSTSDVYRHRYVAGVPVAYVDDPTHELGLAAGGWMSTAGDLVRVMLSTDGLDNHPDVLEPSTLALMERRPHFRSDYAHGWDRVKDGRLRHGGRLGGGTASIAKYPAGFFTGSNVPITVAVCTNISISDRLDGSTALRRVGRSIAEAVSQASVSGSYDLY
ncbi:MAG: serine hydrolase domain-containing protein [Myxococcota bacterium]